MLKYYNYDIVFQEIPNEVTLAVNITNCPNRCKGCHSPHLQKNIGEVLDEDFIISLLDKYASAITCVAFMGGDAAPHRVADLASFVRKHCPQIKTAWYSGREKLPDSFDKQLFHFIKLGAYIEAFGALKSTNTNQRFFKIQKDGTMKDLSSLFQQKRQSA